MGTIFRAILAYWFLLILLRLIYRRAIGGMTPFEMILLFLIGGMTVQAVVGDDRSLINAALALSAIGLMHISVTFLKHRLPRFARIIDGTPVVIVEDGQWHEDRMRKLNIDPQDVMAVGRCQGISHMAAIRDAVVERDGSISIINRRAREDTDRPA